TSRMVSAPLSPARSSRRPGTARVPGLGLSEEIEAGRWRLHQRSPSSADSSHNRSHRFTTNPGPSEEAAVVQRQFPRPADIFELMGFKKPQLNGRTRRLEAALTIEDLRAIAKRRTPRAAFDYTDGAAESELSLARARQAFQDVEFHPSVLRDVANV